MRDSTNKLGYRGRGTYMPYPSNSRPQHLNRSARFNNGQAAPATTPNPNGGAKTNPQPVPASKSSQIGAVDPSAYNSATLSIAGETFRNPSDASIFERSGEVSQRHVFPSAPLSSSTNIDRIVGKSSRRQRHSAETILRTVSDFHVVGDGVLPAALLPSVSFNNS